MMVYPEWALSPSGYALGWQYSRGVGYHVGNPTGVSYLFYYTEHHPLTPRYPQYMTSWNLQNPLGQCNFGAAGLPRWPCWDVIFMYHTEQPTISTGLRLYFSPKLRQSRACCSQQSDNSIVEGGILLIISPRVGILKAWRSQQYRESWNSTLTTGANTSFTWQLVLI